MDSSPMTDGLRSRLHSSPPLSPTCTDTDLPMDIDKSFGSNMSISGGEPFECSPCRTTSFNGSFNSSFGDSATTSNGYLSPASPAPRSKLVPRRPALSPIQTNRQSHGPLPSFALPKRAMTSTIQPFSLGTSGPFAKADTKADMPPPAVPERRMLKARSPLPNGWSTSGEDKENSSSFKTSLFGGPELMAAPSPKDSSFASSGMDLDSPAPTARRPTIAPSPSFSGSASLDSSPGFGAYFEQSPAPAPAAAVNPTKRRSLVDGSPTASGSPSAKRASFGKKAEKCASSSAMLFGATRVNTLASRRPPPLMTKRPALAQVQPMGGSSRAGSAASAYPILEHPKTNVGTFPRGPAGLMRRAYSVCDQPQIGEQSEEDSEFDGSPSVGAAQAEYARRHNKRVDLRVDGSPNFKPIRSSIAAPSQGGASPSRAKSQKSGSFMSAKGMPGFGDNEMDGKILPCHKVKEDGLVRVTPQTVNSLIEGQFSDKIKRYHIIDCRFGYEYEGGHIDGALNVKSMDALDELLLSAASGVHADGRDLPVPSRSGELPDGQQVVLIFHCEFSAKRAPTFAKHLRSRDRSINSASYPKIYYPEVYILEGGYCGFFKSNADRCEPRSYTPMDDPNHLNKRDSDLHNFRSFGRTKSYTFGESSSSNGPACPPMAFAAASAAVGRRGNHASAAGTIAEEEDHETSSPNAAADSSGELADSPCPRAVSMGQGPLFGSAKPRALGRLAFQRNASYAGIGLTR